jgi:hypothetical protein
MKNLLSKAALIFIMVFSIAGCTDRTIERITYDANVPIYMAFDEFRASVKKSEAKDINQPGKMYFKDGFLFVNEFAKGIHIINNSNPSNPQKIAFLEIMGNVDMAIRGNILFADSYIDLVAIDISDINNPVEVGRLENIFPEIAPEGDKWYPYCNVDRSKGVIVGWNVKTVTEEREPGSYNHWFYKGDFLSFDSNSGTRPSWTGGAGVGGSMARFMLNQQYLYVIALPSKLKTIDTEQVDEMTVVDSIDVPRNMETLYSIDNRLFVGTTTGMLIFSIENPQAPRQISSYDHITACDPVVVDGNFAYVTLRTGTMCTNGQNLLEVIDISSIENPFLVKSYPMFNPHGLGVDGNLLFLCDGAAGLKIYDKTDPMQIHMNQIKHYPDFNTFDVIPLNGVLMLVGADGIYQYDYSDPLNIVELSHIQIVKNEE